MLVKVTPGRSRVATILFASEPSVYFDFHRFYSHQAVRNALYRMPYFGGGTMLAKALSFAAGVLWQEQNMKRVAHQLKSLPTPKHDRLQVMVVVSDGISDDDFTSQAAHLHERMLVKIAAVTTRQLNKAKLRPLARHDGAIFTMNEREALSIWLWNAQKHWNDNYGAYVERERTFQSEREMERQMGVVLPQALAAVGIDSSLDVTSSSGTASRETAEGSSGNNEGRAAEEKGGGEAEETSGTGSGGSKKKRKKGRRKS